MRSAGFWHECCVERNVRLEAFLVLFFAALEEEGLGGNIDMVVDALTDTAQRIIAGGDAGD